MTPVRALLIFVVMALVAMVALSIVLAIRAGLTPRPFRTTTGRNAPTAETRRHGRYSEAFAPDLGLQVRMVVTVGVATILLVAVVGGLIYLSAIGWWRLTMFVACFVFIGFAAQRRVPKVVGRRRARPAPAQEQARAEGVVERLCIIGDLRVPEVVIERHPLPLSWTIAGLRRRPHVHLTTALVDRLSHAELEAVIGHELSHIAQSDALLMTFLAAPPATFFRGLRQMIDEEWFRGTLAVLLFGLWLVPAALLMSILARVVSRHRELTADRGAAVLTGSPAAVASALISVASGLAETRRRDLRAIAANDVFHLMPSRRDEPGPLAQMWATHPRLHQRLRRLEAMEERLQLGRGGVTH